MASEDDDCTDCEGSGICHQTERYCTCSMGRELAALPPEGAALPAAWANAGVANIVILLSEGC